MRNKLFLGLVLSIVAIMVFAPGASAFDLSGLLGGGGISCPDGSTADPGQPCPIPGKNNTVLSDGPTGIINLLWTITSWLFTILMVMAVLFIILAAYQYLISGGGDGVSKAHKMLIYAVIAIAVGILSKGIVYVVSQLVG